MSDRWIRRAYSVLERSLGPNAMASRSLAKETTLRVGGPAAIFVNADTFDHLLKTLAVAGDYEIPWIVIGKGSNLLVSDAGIDGIVVRLGADFRKIEVSGEVMRAGAGAMLSLMVQAALKHSLGGLAFAVGIPGTFGGALAGNAGAHGGSIGPLVASATLVTPGGQLVKKRADEIEFGYRKSSLSDGTVILEAALTLEERDPESIAADMERFFRGRKEAQPLNYPSAGSTFKNPPGDSAGRLIEAAGCKGLKVGGAMVSERHANFIINTGDARASDVYDLMNEVRKRVREASGILLEPEIKLLGVFEAEKAGTPWETGA
ncbi:MAG: UDP-N-acetylmuramate dehydrogenase [Candidatus Aquicultorales bacterium]